MRPRFQPEGQAALADRGVALAAQVLLLALGTVLFCLNSPSLAAETKSPPEIWLTNAVEYPLAASAGPIEKRRFDNLRAEFLAGTVKIIWESAPRDAATRAVLHLSVDEPGHWPARDWRSYPMEQRGLGWETAVPVDSLDAPLVYFIQATTEARTNLSPMRLCRPRLLGLEKPTRVFWPFLEGFEEGLESWRWLAGGPANGQLQTSRTAKNGKAALAVTITQGKNSATVGTTRVRGWHLLEHGATGISLWIRTREGTGRIRLTILANAFTTNQVAITDEGAKVSAHWEKLDVPFRRFPNLPLSEVDFLAFELLGDSGCEFLMDDVQMLGRWKLE